MDAREREMSELGGNRRVSDFVPLEVLLAFSTKDTWLNQPNLI